MTTWIKAEDSLPERHVPVLVARLQQTDGTLRVEQGYRDFGEWWRVYGTRVKTNRIIARMLMPDPPALD